MSDNRVTIRINDEQKKFLFSQSDDYSETIRKALDLYMTTCQTPTETNVQSDENDLGFSPELLMMVRAEIAFWNSMNWNTTTAEMNAFVARFLVSNYRFKAEEVKAAYLYAIEHPQKLKEPLGVKNQPAWNLI